MIVESNNSRGRDFEERRRDPQRVGDESRHVISNRCRQLDRRNNHTIASSNLDSSDPKRRRSDQYGNGYFSSPPPIDRVTNSSPNSPHLMSLSNHRHSPPYPCRTNGVSNTIQSQGIRRFDHHHTPDIRHSREEYTRNDSCRPVRRDVDDVHIRSDLGYSTSLPSAIQSHNAPIPARYEQRSEKNRFLKSNRNHDSEEHIQKGCRRRESAPVGDSDDRRHRPVRTLEATRLAVFPTDGIGCNRARRFANNWEPFPVRNSLHLPFSRVTVGFVQIPFQWRKRPSGISEWKLFSESIYKHGSATDLLSFKLFRDLILSPTNGIAAHALPLISCSLTAAPHLVNHIGSCIVPVAAYPNSIRKFLTMSLAILFAKHKVFPNGQVDASGAPALSVEGDVDEDFSEENKAIQILVENLAYGFELSRANTSGPDRIEGNGSFLSRGKPFSYSDVPKGNFMASLDPLYARIMKRLHFDYKNP